MLALLVQSSHELGLCSFYLVFLVLAMLVSLDFILLSSPLVVLLYLINYDCGNYWNRFLISIIILLIISSVCLVSSARLSMANNTLIM